MGWVIREEPAMPTRRQPTPTGLVAHIVDVLGRLGPVECVRFFGGWALRVDGVMFAMVMREELYLTVDDALRADLVAAGCEPFSYAKGGSRVITSKLYAAPGGCLDDPDDLCSWAARAISIVKRG
jgi:DNA transformation protein